MRDGTGLPSVQHMDYSRTAVSTGGSRGLGLALARGLAEDGYALVLDARDGEALRAAAASLPPGTPVTAVPGDIAEPAHRAALKLAADQLGGTDLLINNVGTLCTSPLPAICDCPIDDLRTTFEINVLAPLALTQLLLPDLRRRGGAVLAVTSDAAVEAYAGWGGYGAAKAALDQACNVLAAGRPRRARLHGAAGRGLAGGAAGGGRGGHRCLPRRNSGPAVEPASGRGPDPGRAIHRAALASQAIHGGRAVPAPPGGYRWHEFGDLHLLLP